MKSCYFTAETIDEKSREMLSQLENFRKKHSIDFLPDQSALLILDMQKYFLDERSHAFIPSALPVVSKIKKLANSFIEINAPVILTRHINSIYDDGLMSRWWHDRITEKDYMSEIIPELNFSNTMVIKKTQYDAFYRTPLEDILRGKKISQLVVTGVMSHLCCESTARSAFVRDFTVLFPVDGTATYNEEFHRATLLTLSHGFAVPVLTEELLLRIEAYRDIHN